MSQDISKLKQAVATDIDTIKQTYAGLGITASIFSFFQGRATFFAILFSVEGLALIGVSLWGFIHGRDVTGMASIITAVAGLDGAIFAGVVGHSIKEDYFERRKKLDEQQNPPAAS